MTLDSRVQAAKLQVMGTESRVLVLYRRSSPSKAVLGVVGSSDWLYVRIVLKWTNPDIMVQITAQVPVFGAVIRPATTNLQESNEDCAGLLGLCQVLPKKAEGPVAIPIPLCFLCLPT